ncbi:hypothetical protein [Streptomyces nigrescens]|uniref:hypothetical protein n=1 Tax=Streptomyces nigrescens TaxID=1920 RepID=UPI00225154F4|nr:hypothetical protein [Streptomyces libani]MCX5449913.1 hypothetical protein [Streptomyces libani]
MAKEPPVRAEAARAGLVPRGVDQFPKAGGAVCTDGDPLPTCGRQKAARNAACMAERPASGAWMNTRGSIFPTMDRLLQEALEVARTSMFIEIHEASDQSVESKLNTDHAIDLLSAYLRGDPLPEASRSVERRRFERALYELENLRVNPVKTSLNFHPDRSITSVKAGTSLA